MAYQRCHLAVRSDRERVRRRTELAIERADDPDRRRCAAEGSGWCRRLCRMPVYRNWHGRAKRMVGLCRRWAAQAE